MYPFNVQRLVGTPDIVTTRLNDERQTSMMKLMLLDVYIFLQTVLCSIYWALFDEKQRKIFSRQSINDFGKMT
ncbi:hypothetical protein V1477_015335 [Vespula maculifrons]|uniref:Uncharacterized protein n=1 Tax=Vespula maculifrons TaxID=7453 RepID=A0ABD2BFI2_VESMC